MYAAADVTYLFKMYSKWSPHVTCRFIIEETQRRMQCFIQRQPTTFWVMSLIDFTPSVNFQFGRSGVRQRECTLAKSKPSLYKKTHQPPAINTV